MTEWRWGVTEKKGNTPQELLEFTIKGKKAPKP